MLPDVILTKDKAECDECKRRREYVPLYKKLAATKYYICEECWRERVRAQRAKYPFI